MRVGGNKTASLQIHRRMGTSSSSTMDVTCLNWVPRRPEHCRGWSHSDPQAARGEAEEGGSGCGHAGRRQKGILITYTVVARWRLLLHTIHQRWVTAVAQAIVRSWTAKEEQSGVSLTKDVTVHLLESKTSPWVRRHWRCAHGRWGLCLEPSSATSQSRSASHYCAVSQSVFCRTSKRATTGRDQKPNAEDSLCFWARVNGQFAATPKFS